MLKLLLQGLVRSPLTEPRPKPDDPELAELAAGLDRAARRRLGRSLSIREVDAGSCNGCELEIHALQNAFYDLERFGLRFVASPRHADVLLVTGPVTKNMREALERTYNATPSPKWGVAVGDCALNVGDFAFLHGPPLVARVTMELIARARWNDDRLQPHLTGRILLKRHFEIRLGLETRSRLLGLRCL